MSLVTSPRTQSTRSTARDPKSVELSARPDGSFGALSSDGNTIYTVRTSPLSCQCKGFSARGTCCHAIAAAQVAVCYWCNRLGRDVQTFVNRWDNNAAISLCPDCFPGGAA